MFDWIDTHALLCAAGEQTDVVIRFSLTDRDDQSEINWISDIFLIKATETVCRGLQWPTNRREERHTNYTKGGRRVADVMKEHLLPKPSVISAKRGIKFSQEGEI